jgi:hypothetical protein
MWTNWPSLRLQSPEPANLCSPLNFRADNEERADSAIRSLTFWISGTRRDDSWSRPVARDPPFCTVLVQDHLVADGVHNGMLCVLPGWDRAAGAGQDASPVG